MKIEPSTSTIPVVQTGTRTATSSAEANDADGTVQPAGATAEQTSPVTLSSMSTLRASSGPDIDQAKVDAVKAALRDGTYRIDSSKIAEGMLSTARDLLQARKA